MPQNFLTCDREQALLLPPDLRDWLAADHLAWLVLDVVEEIDIARFLAAYRQDGWGRAAFDPAMMVALLLYAYAIGERRSQRIEQRCREDIAFRVMCQHHARYATIARFRVRHEQALGDLFTSVLALCAQAGHVEIGVIAVDGTKIAADASMRANRTYEQIAREILEEATAADAADDVRSESAAATSYPPSSPTARRDARDCAPPKSAWRPRCATRRTPTPRACKPAQTLRLRAAASCVDASRSRRRRSSIRPRA